VRLEVLGSGGAAVTPKPLCSCASCVQARRRGPRYSRLGPSVFLHGPDILIDTPEEISVELGRSSVEGIAACLYSHWHPDHTAGRRVFEMGKDWTRHPPENRRTRVILTERIAATFDSRMAIGDHFRYMSGLGLVDVETVADDREFEIGGYSVRPFSLGFDYVFGYAVQGGGKSVLVVMDELKGWVPDERILATDFDIAYLPLGILDVDPFTGRRLMDASHPIFQDEQSVGETLGIVEALRARKVLLSHVEEPDNVTLAMGRRLSKLFSKRLGRDIEIAYDTMSIEA
jgi:phosphoribosyl 1,2-cyclic phosphate phosphodiesterase